jgi:predicted glycoside hydrolase/deacetylase ChbG (UPF0249 family)
MARIVINGDDFGYSDGICRSIVELLEIGAITGTSLMCAAPGAIERMRQWDVQRLKGVAGVHLQLSGGSPLSPLGEVESLVDRSTGAFQDPRKDGPPLAAEVEIEWRKQIEVATTLLQGKPTHLDSHHGVHRIPQFVDLYLRLAAELGVPVRGGSEDMRPKLRASGVPGSVVTVRDWTGRSLGPEVLRAMVQDLVLRHPTEDFIEVVTHPGYSDSYLESVSSLSTTREDDHRALLELKNAGWPAIDGHVLVSQASLESNWA